MFGLGAGELVIVAVVVILLFGGKKIPQLGSAMGKALTNFKKGLREDQEQETESEKLQDNGPSKDDQRP